MSKSAAAQLASIRAGLEAKAAKLRADLAVTQQTIDQIEAALKALQQ